MTSPILSSPPSTVLNTLEHPPQKPTKQVSFLRRNYYKMKKSSRKRLLLYTYGGIVTCGFVGGALYGFKSNTKDRGFYSFTNGLMGAGIIATAPISFPIICVAAWFESRMAEMNNAILLLATCQLETNEELNIYGMTVGVILDILELITNSEGDGGNKMNHFSSPFS